MGIADSLRRTLFGPPKFEVDAPAPDTKVEELPILAVDMETTGTDPHRDEVLSIGWVPINGERIDLSGAGSVVISGTEVGDSAVIHGLTDDEVAQGIPIDEGITQLIDALRGRALLAHFAALETGFIDKYCPKIFDGTVPDLAVIDTFVLERRHMERMATYPRGEDLRLARVRERYNLPAYGNHNALSDALACAEVYLALCSSGRFRTLNNLMQK